MLLKKLYLLPALLAAGAMTFTACSSSDDVSGSGDNGDGINQYISVNVTSGADAPIGAKPYTRVVENQPTGPGNIGNGKYESGSTEENQVNHVRFYFFDANGNPARQLNGKNFVDYDFTGRRDSQTPAGGSGTVASRTKAILVYRSADGQRPAKIAALVNPEALNLGDNLVFSATPSESQGTSFSETELRNLAATQTFATTNSGKISNFAMASAVYNDGTTQHFSESTAGHFYNSQTEALSDQHPVDIYVERLASKVKVNAGSDSRWQKIENVKLPKIGMEDNETNRVDTTVWAYKLQTVETTGIGSGDLQIDVENGTVDENGQAETTKRQVYAVVYGWGLADEQLSGFPVKQLNTSEYSNLGFSPVSTKEFHRSFWENIPDYSRTSHPWNQYKLAMSDDAGITYTMPNIPLAATTLHNANFSNGPTDRTKIVLAARLMWYDETNKIFHPIQVVKYQGTTYGGMIDAKRAVCIQHSNIKVSVNGGDYAPLNQNNITFEYKNDYDAQDNYQVVAKFNEVAGSTYSFKNETTGAAMVLSDVDYELAGGTTPDVALVYNDGLTYYYTTIQHLAATQANTPESETANLPLGYYGVVRNHAYNITVNSLRGFGTPVWEPGRDIVPENPIDQNWYMGATINVLQWRVVNQTVDISGGQ